MRKFRNTFNRSEVVTLEEIFQNPEFTNCMLNNYKDDVLFADWLISRDYTPFDIWEMDTRERAKARNQFLYDCREMAITDLDYEEIFD